MAGTPITGRYCAIQSGTSDPVNLVGHWEINTQVAELDASAFGSVWNKNLTGRMSWSGSMSGFLEVPSTSPANQVAYLLKPSLNATKLQNIKFYLNTASSCFIMPQFTTLGASTTSTDWGCYISNTRIVADKNNLVTLDCDFVGYGGWGIFTATSDASSGLICESTY